MALFNFRAPVISALAFLFCSIISVAHSQTVVAPTETWTQCASEEGLCSYTGTHRVRYGAGTSWSVLERAAVGGGIQCNNWTFGDPAVGTRKACYVSSAVIVAAATETWTQCASEEGLCGYTGTRRVRYGAGTSWSVLTRAANGGGIQCNNWTFGDPAVGTTKACYLSSAIIGGTAANTAPTISGTPPSSVAAASAYSFRPAASDANGDPLTFKVSNLPSWATFNTATGQLAGTPSAANVGTYANIVVSVSDGTATASLPGFSIAVNQIANGNVSLTWYPPTENIDNTVLSNLAGYNIHYGTSAGALNQTVKLASVGLTSYVVGNLSPGTYYFAIDAFTTSGDTSDLSNTVTKVVQ